LTDLLIGQFGYVGIALLLVLGGLGLPVPEEAPVIAAAVLSRLGKMWWPAAFLACLTGVLMGDFVVYFIAFIYGEKVMSLRLTRKFLTKARESQIQGYFHRHGFKILILGRFAVGFRTAAYLTAGILKLPPLKLFLTDLFAASLSTVLMFGLGYVFAYQIEQIVDRAKFWLTAGVAVLIGAGLIYRYYKARQRVGLPVGPKVLETVDVPLPPDDLHAPIGEFRVLGPPPEMRPVSFRGEGLASGSGIRPTPVPLDPSGSGIRPAPVPLDPSGSGIRATPAPHDAMPPAPRPVPIPVAPDRPDPVAPASSVPGEPRP
jgi:membrane protein DedA with SNARE-associated domain